MPPTQKPSALTLSDTGDFASDVDRPHDPLGEIVVPRQMALLDHHVAPGHNEDGVALLDGVAHERIGRLQIEHVELVDAGRKQDQGPRAYRLRERLVLDQLKQLVLEDHGTGRNRQIAADLESLLVGHRDAAFAEILEQVPHTRRHAVAAGLHRTPDHLGIAGKVVRRAQRIQDLPCEETHSCPRPVVEGRTFDQIVHVAGVHEVRLFEKLVIRAFLPLLACEPPIALRRLHGAGTKMLFIHTAPICCK